MTEQPNGQMQTLAEHLIELRRRLIWTLLVILAAFLAVIPFAQNVYVFVAQPLMASLPKGTGMIATDVVDCAFFCAD